MPRIVYKEKRFSIDNARLIGQANEIIAEYQAAGFVLTLRQLYYQFVARDLLPNTIQSYKRLVSLISDARLAGMVDWLAIEDRTRDLVAPPAWDSPADIIDTCSRQYQVDKWEGQQYRPEVWIEKEALVGVIERVCQEMNVAYFACRGNASQSEVWRHGQRFARMAQSGQTPILIYLGDHDPTGVDITRDVRDRMTMFMDEDCEVVRIALNMDQINQYNPPPNPAKPTDSRYKKYAAKYGKDCWELDALEPQVIADLIRDKILEYRDEEIWDERQADEDMGRLRLAALAKRERERE